jgi:hypothetical protein
MKVARVLHGKELKYRSIIESRGISSETFINTAIETGYMLAMATIDEMAQEITLEDLTKAKIISSIGKTRN